jgi:DNA-directed RNA polymerase specialized sigma24 family protein
VQAALPRIEPAHAALLVDAYEHDQIYAELAAARGLPRQKIERRMTSARRVFISAYS